ncbi:hypothetical protein [Acinetobacter seifertii]|uniref:hypothetical protein n=1 Tax=Acinetobacter seifertii TaxID=1530123 RepID=UPI000A301E16|nr:hypothetical protein [Acinetobacter seifertii]OUC59089.1 hypothetical protein MWQ_10215 [Acinetobacter seifertii]
MFIFNQGREPFNKFMTTVLTQIIFGGIALLLLYKSTVLPIAIKTSTFYLFTAFIWIAFFLWIKNTYRSFINDFKSYLYPRVKGVQFLEFDSNEPITFKEIWNSNKKLAMEYFLIIGLIIGILIFIFFGSGISAVQIAETIHLK